MRKMLFCLVFLWLFFVPAFAETDMDDSSSGGSSGGISTDTLTVNSSADTSSTSIINSGNVGNGISWSITDAGELIISGEGEMPDFDYYEPYMMDGWYYPYGYYPPWYDYRYTIND